MEIQINCQQGLYRKMELSQRRNKEYSSISNETETSLSSGVQEKTPDYNEKAFESLAPNAPEKVRNAWLEAAKETGGNGMGMLQNGIPIMTMGPICIANDLKRKGYGKILLDYSLEKAKEMGAGALCFEGNIDFYGKSGFDFASKYGIRYHGLPEGEDASFFLCKELIPGYLDGVTGEYATPEGYFVDEEEAEKFDAGFPYKEKLSLPGQLV